MIGIGEIAISDKRSSHIGMREFAELSSQVYTGGLVSGKAGIVHIHVGDGLSGLEPLLNLLQNTELPREIFVPTHINRNPKLFKKGIAFCRMGGNIDLTAGEKIGVSVPDALVELIKAIPNLDRVTVSSDANGSSATGAMTVQTLYEDIKTCILKYNIPPEVVFRPVTENVARVLKMYPKKGTLKEGSDADIIITDSQYNIQKLFSKGLLVVNDGKAIRK